VNVGFRINGVVVLNRTATGSKYSWKLPKKENITIRIPKKLAKKREPSPARRESSPARRQPSPARSHRPVQEDVISEADIGSDDEDNSDLSDLPSDDSEEELLPQSDKKRRRKEKILTARQRSLVDGDSAVVAPLMSIQDRKRPDKTLTTEQVNKKRQQATKRKIQQEKAAEKTKQETIDKILNAKGEKYKREAKQNAQATKRKERNGLEEPHVRWQSSATERSGHGTISFSAECSFIPPLFKTLFVK